MRLYEFDISLAPRSGLNPVLWTKGRLNPEIKPQLLKIAQDFQRYCEVDFTVYDVQITGGQVSYWWTQWSDLDLHLVVDYRGIDCDRELEELFDTKRHLYNRKYDIAVFDIPVELYVEDLQSPAQGAAYSLVQDRWIRQPQEPRGQVDIERVYGLSKSWAKTVRGVLLQKDLDLAKKTQEKLRQIRQNGLKRGGEFDEANLAYKALRNTGLLRSLAEFIDRAHAQALSLDREAESAVSRNF